VIVLVPLLIILVLVLLNAGALGPGGRGIVTAALLPALVVGGISFAIGFFGPIMWAPEANQGPLLGIFITGPAGFVLGLVGGIAWEWRRRQSA
jgi:hypothetical protein